MAHTGLSVPGNHSFVTCSCWCWGLDYEGPGWSLGCCISVVAGFGRNPDCGARMIAWCHRGCSLHLLSMTAYCLKSVYRAKMKIAAPGYWTMDWNSYWHLCLCLYSCWWYPHWCFGWSYERRAINRSSRVCPCNLSSTLIILLSVDPPRIPARIQPNCYAFFRNLCVGIHLYSIATCYATNRTTIVSFLLPTHHSCMDCCTSHETTGPSTATEIGRYLTNYGCGRRCPCSRMNHMPRGLLSLWARPSPKGSSLLLAFHALFYSFAKYLVLGSRWLKLTKFICLRIFYSDTNVRLSPRSEIDMGIPILRISYKCLSTDDRSICLKLLHSTISITAKMGEMVINYGLSQFVLAVRFLI